MLETRRYEVASNGWKIFVLTPSPKLENMYKLPKLSGKKGKQTYPSLENFSPIFQTMWQKTLFFSTIKNTQGLSCQLSFCLAATQAFPSRKCFIVDTFRDIHSLASENNINIVLFSCVPWDFCETFRDKDQKRKTIEVSQLLSLQLLEKKATNENYIKFQNFTASTCFFKVKKSANWEINTKSGQLIDFYSPLKKNHEDHILQAQRGLIYI